MTLMEFNKIAQWLSFTMFALAGLIHIGFFIFESYYLQKSHAREFLKMSEIEHKSIKPWALNQGFYNLFLAVGVFIGLTYVRKLQIMMAGLMISFAGGCMIVAGVVLFFSVPKMRKLALLQAGVPAVGFVFLAIHVLSFILSK